MKHLGETFDIHCGGEDLIFPHHEDEIAQSEAATGKPFVRYWLHNAHLLIEGKKMSKSLGNFYTLRDLLELKEKWTGREIRYALIVGHYRDQLNFTFDGLQAARSALQRIDAFLMKLREIAQTPPGLAHQTNYEERTQRLIIEFELALDDDLNISAAFAVLFDFIKNQNRRITVRQLFAPEAQLILDTWPRLFGDVLGLIPAKSQVPAEVLALVEERQAARKAKNFGRSDEIRLQLIREGWLIEDTPAGPRIQYMNIPERIRKALEGM
jgi:cysteinyl-tRNA synthetase